MPRSARPRPAPPWTASTGGAMASRSLSCPGSPAPSGRGRPRSSHFTPPTVAPTASPRPSTCWSRRSSVSATASATSPTTAYGCYSTAASRGRLPRPPGCEVAPRAWWCRAGLSAMVAAVSSRTRSPSTYRLGCSPARRRGRRLATAIGPAPVQRVAGGDGGGLVQAADGNGRPRSR
jgi:hypothetical protein